MDRLAAERPRFVSFVSARVSDRAAAEDIVQTAFGQAVQDSRDLEGVELARWFYRVLRNAIVDRHRRVTAESRGVERWQADPTTHAVAAVPRAVCGCVRSALQGLDPTQRSVLEAVELDGLKPAAYGHREGISAGNAAVRLHRARRKLAERLKSICGTCTLDGCADCDCGHQASHGAV